MAHNKKPRTVTDDYEILEQCGQGTYGFVFKAIHKQSKTIVALKKVTKFPTEDGAPVEIKYLSQLTSSRNVIRLRDHFFTKEGELVLVFEYMETDLWKLISGPNVCLPLHHVKCVMKQLLEGLNQCHAIGIMHRDVKPSNLLINSSGLLKLADFGLTTSFTSPPYLSSNVVSLYYRPPELLMGSHAYGPEIDVWSAGCILVELLISDYLFAGANEAEQLNLIFKVFGTPSEDIWPGVTQLSGWGLVDTSTTHPIRELKDNYTNLEAHVVDLASKLLVLNPKKRISCQEALQHPWFSTTPLPSHPNNLPVLWRQMLGEEPAKEWRKAITTNEIRQEGGSALPTNTNNGSNKSEHGWSKGEHGWKREASMSRISNTPRKANETGEVAVEDAKDVLKKSIILGSTPHASRSNTPLIMSRSNTPSTSRNSTPNNTSRNNSPQEGEMYAEGVSTIIPTKSPKGTPRAWTREKSKERMSLSLSTKF